MLRKISTGDIVSPPFTFNGIRYQDNIETMWNAAQLAAIGLEVYTPTLAEQKATKREALAAKRFEVETGGVVYQGKTYLSDRDSQPKYIAIFVMAVQNPAFQTEWKTGDGSFVTLTADKIAAVAMAVQSKIQTAFSHEAVLATQIEAATDVDALNAIDINTGW